MIMNMDANQSEVNAEAIRIAISKRLSPRKYEHSINVAKYARLIATKTTIDPEKMYIAGLLHDVANGLSNEEILRLCEKSDRFIPSNEVQHAQLLHGIAGACIAYEDFGIRDNEILMAIAFHSGRVGMRQEEKILFLADVIDHEDNLGVDSTQIWKKKDLDSAILTACADMTKYCVEHELPAMDQRMLDSFDYIIEHLRKNSDSKEPSYSSLRRETDEIIDKAMDIFLSHRLKITSVKNIRDIGNYRTYSGGKIKKGKIIRSSDLSQMTPEDAEHLKRLGINSIIDLRTEDEIADATDRNIDDFRYYNCPLPKLEAKESSKRLLEYIKSSISEEEKAWYATEYMRYVNMRQLYRDVLLSDASVEQLRKVFDILFDKGTQGVLIHCSNGKDRTGIVIMLIQFALGMNEEEILGDYYASAVPYYMITENAVLILEQNGYSSDFREKARELLSINVNMISELNRWWQENQYGTTENYLRNTMRISQEQLELLRGKYLEA